MADKGIESAAKAAGMISLLYLGSRLLGFVRENLSGRLFTRFETDAFFAAFIIPDIMYYLLVGGALSAAFIPIFSEYLANDKEEEGWKMASTFINTVLVLLFIFTVFGVVFAQLLAPLEAPSFSAGKMDLLIKLTRIMFPAVCFTALAGLTGGALNSYRRFLAPALGPIVYNIAIILGAFFLGEQYGIGGMAIGVVVGAFGNFLLQFCFLHSISKGKYKFGYIDLKNTGFRRMLRLMLPALIGLSATQVNLWVTNVMASSLDEGSITALRFANRLIQLPIGIFAAGVATAFFPLLSRLAATKEYDEFKNVLSMSLCSIFFMMIPAAVGLIVLRYPLVKLLFEGQKFTPHDTALTAYALLFYSLTLFAHAAILMLPRAFYALQDTKTPVIISITAVALSICLNWIFLKYTTLGIGGFALSFSIMGFVNFFFLIVILHRRMKGINGRHILVSFAKTTLASLLMGVAIYVVTIAVSKYAMAHNFIGSHWEAALNVFVGMIVGVTVFAVAAWLLKIDEMQTALNIMKRKLKLKGSN